MGTEPNSRYPLTGVREATTEPQEALIAQATEVLEADDRVVAVYLVGGFAVGTGDAFSDVDLQVLVADDAVDDIAASWGDLVARIATRPRPADPGRDWRHRDYPRMAAL